MKKNVLLSVIALGLSLTASIASADSQCTSTVKLVRVIGVLQKQGNLSASDQATLAQAQSGYNDIRNLIETKFIVPIIDQNRDADVSGWFSGSQKSMRIKGFVDTTIMNCMDHLEMSMFDVAQLTLEQLLAYIPTQRK
jgi:hypothetical protein